MSSPESAVTQLDEKTKGDITRWAEAEVGKAKVRSAIHSFTDICFKKCIKDAGSPNLNSTESSCVKSCVEGFLDTNIQIVELISKQAQ